MFKSFCIAIMLVLLTDGFSICADTSILSEEELYVIGGKIAGDFWYYLSDTQKEDYKGMSDLKKQEWKKTEEFKEISKMSKENSDRLKNTCFSITLSPKVGFAGYGKEEMFGEYDVNEKGFWITPEHKCSELREVYSTEGGPVIGSVIFPGLKARAFPHPRKPRECSYQFFLITVPDSIASPMENSSAYNYTINFSVSNVVLTKRIKDPFWGMTTTFQLARATSWRLQVNQNGAPIWEISKAQQNKRKK